MFTFLFEARPEDAVRYHYFVLEEQPDNKIRANVRRSVVFLCYAILATFLFVRGRYAFAMAVMVAAVAFFLLIKPVNRLQIRLRVKALWKKHTSPDDAKVELRFDDDVFALVNARGESRVKYADLKNVYEKNGYLFLILNNGSGVYLPYRAFRSEVEYTVFKQFLSLKIGKPIPQ